MIRGITDYLKVIKNNSYTLAGYSLLTAGSIATTLDIGFESFPSYIDEIIYSTSALGLVASQFGVETLKAYRKTTQHIDNFGEVSTLFRSKLSSRYCARVGIEMAEKEAGLEKII